jgi:hypothetical protein
MLHSDRISHLVHTIGATLLWVLLVVSLHLLARGTRLIIVSDVQRSVFRESACPTFRPPSLLSRGKLL